MLMKLIELTPQIEEAMGQYLAAERAMQERLHGRAEEGDTTPEAVVRRALVRGYTTIAHDLGKMDEESGQ